MKKCSSHNAAECAARGPRGTAERDTSANIHEILKLAYRRHARGRVARAAVNACLGR